jgi:hypothetical protein
MTVRTDVDMSNPIKTRIAGVGVVHCLMLSAAAAVSCRINCPTPSPVGAPSSKAVVNPLETRPAPPDVRTGQGEIDRQLNRIRHDYYILFARDEGGHVKALAMEVGGPADSAFKRLPRLPNVEEIDLSYTMLTDDGIRMLVKKCPNLERLDIHGCSQVSTDAAEELSAARRLKFVEVGGQPEILESMRKVLGDRVNPALLRGGDSAWTWKWRDHLR